MLFTTSTFALLFLPLTWVGFFVIGGISRTGAAAWLFGASLVFYGYWMPTLTPLLVASIAANFAIGLRIQRALARSRGAARRWLVAGIVLDLGLLAYFKYATFFLNSVNGLAGTQWTLGHIVLPIGISFYTFTQIAFLVDAYQGKVGETRPVHYGLFVSYFPHLVAGPVLHHAQMMPQFADAAVYRPRLANVAGGLFIFCIGLAKKVVFADGVAPYADAVFGPADLGALPTPAEAWLGAIAYTLQLYFDFSGYSDMAIGLSWMFNIKLPFNFDSPYRARSISDFWRRWHMSLSTFLRDYLYVPLGGNRRGRVRRYANLMVTMLLGGLWHGASWTFVAWGGLHGLYLMINHGFRALVGEAHSARARGAQPMRAAAWALTMLSVVVAWVFFRSATFSGAGRMLVAMMGADTPAHGELLLWNAGLHPAVGALWCGVLGCIAVMLPNSNTMGSSVLEALRERRYWQHLAASASLAGALMLVVLNSLRESVSPFIYFNF